MTRQAIDPDAAWGLPEMLLAQLIDELRALRWEFERVNFKSRARPPEPFPRPGVSPPQDTTTYGGGAAVLPIEEMTEWLGWTAPRPTLPPRDARGRFTAR